MALRATVIRCWRRPRCASDRTPSSNLTLMKKTNISLLLAAIFTAVSNAKQLPRPNTPNPGLRYYYPVPKTDAPRTYDFDIVIYGASPAAVSAACQAKKLGKTVGVFVFRRHIGGMSSSGLSDVDYGKKTAIGGMAKTGFLDFVKKQVQRPAGGGKEKGKRGGGERGQGCGVRRAFQKRGAPSSRTSPPSGSPRGTRFASPQSISCAPGAAF